jgi:DNA-binding PucR family transcriptional regulator
LEQRSAEECQLLLATLNAWFECDGNSADAAARLYCHRNTVSNRLRRVEELTGHSLSSPRSTALLYVALRAQPFTPPD